MKKIKISPSLMCANFINLKNDIDVFLDAKIDYLHIDIMDGHYVPNFTLGIDFCKTLVKYTDIPLDIHLMIENVDKFIPDFAKLENAVVTIHPEVSYHPIRSLQLIKSYGAKAGIAIDPALPVENIKYLLPDVDLVCVMTVNPGYAGQKLIPQTLKKIREVSDYIADNGYDVGLEVDGNVSWKNIPDMLAAGADVLVAGSSSIFEKNGDLKTNINRMQSMLTDPEKK